MTAMTKSIHDLAELLKGFVNDNRPDITEPVDWKRVFQLARSNSISGIVGYMIMKYELTDLDEINEIAIAECTNTVGMTTRRIMQANRLIKVFQERSIDLLLTKGYVVRDYYPEPRLRTFGDIDFLVQTSDRDKVHKIMKEMGYTVKTDWEPVYSYKRDSEYYEVHTELMDLDFQETQNTVEYFKNAWEYAKQIDNNIYVLKPEYHLLYLTAHLAKHIITGGAGMRMYMDIALFIKNNPEVFDWTFVEEQVKTLKLNKYTDYLFSAVENWFDIKCPPHNQCGDEILEHMLRITVMGGTFGKDHADPGVMKLKAMSRISGKDSKLSALINMVLPPASSLKKRYTYLEDKPWLLPAAWVHRIFVNRQKIGLETKIAKKVLHANMSDIEDRDSVISEIGLK